MVNMYPKTILSLSTLPKMRLKSRTLIIQYFPSGMLTRITKARTGRSNIYIDLSLPFKKGIKRAPQINIAAGGIMLIIIVLFSLYEYT
jgi:hypothetical protein